MASIGDTSDDPFLRGVQAGVVRAARRDLLQGVDPELPYLNPELIFREVVSEYPTLEMTRGLLGRETSGRFTELFAEMVTVAVIARRAYGDPALTELEIESYLQQSHLFFNSFRHA
jgi:hypothetical protein